MHRLRHGRRVRGREGLFQAFLELAARARPARLVVSASALHRRLLPLRVTDGQEAGAKVNPAASASARAAPWRSAGCWPADRRPGSCRRARPGGAFLRRVLVRGFRRLARPVGVAAAGTGLRSVHESSPPGRGMRRPPEKFHPRRPSGRRRDRRPGRCKRFLAYPGNRRAFRALSRVNLNCGRGWAWTFGHWTNLRSPPPGDASNAT